jgi:putative ABC transport system permease protein
MSSLRAETVYAIRSLARTPSFTVAVTLTLALGIGVGTTVFTAFEVLVLRPLPYPASDRLVAITYHLRDPDRLSGTGAPVPAVIRWRDGAREFDALSWYAVTEQTLRTWNSDRLAVPVAAVSSGFFSTLGVPAAALGRGLQPEDARPGARAVAVLSHRFWQTHFSGADVLGHSLWVNRQEHEIVGIAGSRLTFPDHPQPDVLVPMTELQPGEPVVRFVKVIGRLREGASAATAQADLVSLTDVPGEDYPTEMFAFLAAGGTPRVTMLKSHASRAARPILPATLVGGAVLLLLVCANVSGLLLARLFSRQRELAIRAALGAPLLAQARSVWLEVGLLATLATTASLLAVWWAHGVLRALLSSVTPYGSDLTMSVPVVAFAFGIAALTTVVCAAWPTVRIARGEAGAGTALNHTTDTRQSGNAAHRALVTAQVALAAVLLVAGLLLAATLSRLTGDELGFSPASTLTVRIPAVGLGPEARRMQAVSDVLERLRTVQGVEAAGMSTSLPLGGHSFYFVVAVEGEAPPPGDPRDGPAVDAISAGFVRALGIRLTAGRDIQQTDRAESPPVALVNEAFVRNNLAGRDPLGRRIGLSSSPEAANVTIVGVVDDVRDTGPGDPVRPRVYIPYTQAGRTVGWHTAVLAVRTSGDPRRMAETVRRTVAAVAPEAFVYDVRTMEERVAALIAPQRQRATVGGVMGILALGLAGLGLYGLLAYTVERGMHEFSVRRALGAGGADIVRLIVWRGLRSALVGLLAGVPAAFLLARVIAGFLYGVAPDDPFIYALAAGLIVLVTLLAVSAPAWRAVRADPLALLRAE